MNGYFLFGTNDEVILVFKSSQEEDILNIIKKISTMRNKEIKQLAENLESEFYVRSKEVKEFSPKKRNRSSKKVATGRPKRKTE